MNTDVGRQMSIDGHGQTSKSVLRRVSHGSQCFRLYEKSLASEQSDY